MYLNYYLCHLAHNKVMCIFGLWLTVQLTRWTSNISARANQPLTAERPTDLKCDNGIQ